jgi:hypothetical protein
VHPPPFSPPTDKNHPESWFTKYRFCSTVPSKNEVFSFSSGSSFLQIPSKP